MMMWIFSKRALFYTVYIIIIIIKYYYTYKSLYVFLFNRFANMSDSKLLTEALAHNKLACAYWQADLHYKTVCAL